MFDTHCHLNFKRFEKNVDEVVKNAHAAGMTQMIVPGTDIVSSKKAIEIAQKYDGIYAAVGIHPHHVYEHHVAQNMPALSEVEGKHVTQKLEEIESLLKSDGKTSGVTGTGSPDVEEEQQVIVAIGEIGLDRHMYQNTKYGEYIVDEEFMKLQKEFFVAQLVLAKKYQKSVIIHNREATKDILEILGRPAFAKAMAGKMVFHCCEPDDDLLDFAKQHHIFIGVDGDVTYWPEKAEFIKQVPLEMLVLETDSPFLLPEPLRSQKKFPNVPANIPLIAEYVAKKRGEDIEIFKKQTTENGLNLFKLQP